MAIADDISIAINGNIRYTGTVANYTVIELHRFFGELMDDAEASGDDLLDITSATASERATDNLMTLNSPYNVDAALMEHIYDGSIVQTGGDDIWDGVVNFGNAGVYIELVQDGALIASNFWTTGINADAAQGISHRFTVKTRTAGADIDGRRLLGFTREFGNTWGEFPINGTSRGNNVLAISSVDDINNNTAEATVATWTTIINTEGYRLIDVDNNAVNEAYYSEWNKATFTINQLIERGKWLQRRGSVSTLYGLNGMLFRGVTHEMDVDGQGVTDFSAVEPISWTGGTGQLLAVDDVNAASKIWFQLLTGVAPSADNLTITGGTSGATCLTEFTGGAIVARDIQKTLPFMGQSTGSAIIGNYGVGIESADLGASDKVIDLTNTQIIPPNNVTWTASGLVIGEDYILVGPESAGTLDTAFHTLSGTLNGVAVTSVVMTAAIPTDVKASGTLRIILDTGIHKLVTYTSYTGSTYTIPSTDFSGINVATTGNNAYPTWIDKLATATSEAFTTVYLADRNLFVRVRDGGGTPIKTAESVSVLGSAGGGTTISRISDT